MSLCFVLRRGQQDRVSLIGLLNIGRAYGDSNDRKPLVVTSVLRIRQVCDERGTSKNLYLISHCNLSGRLDCSHHITRRQWFRPDRLILRSILVEPQHLDGYEAHNWQA